MGYPLCVTKRVPTKAHPQQFIWVISLIDSCLETLLEGLKKTYNVQKCVYVCGNQDRKSETVTFSLTCLRLLILNWYGFTHYTVHARSLIMKYGLTMMFNTILYLLYRSLRCDVIAHSAFRMTQMCSALLDYYRLYKRAVSEPVIKAIDYSILTLSGLCSAIGLLASVSPSQCLHCRSFQVFLRSCRCQLKFLSSGDFLVLFHALFRT